MKIHVAPVLVLLLAVLGACGECCGTDEPRSGAGEQAAAVRSEAAPARAVTASTEPHEAGVYVVKVDGMTCMQGCGNRVIAALKTIDEVQDVQIDLEAQTATVTLAEGVSDEDLRLALADLPYAFGGVSRAGA